MNSKSVKEGGKHNMYSKSKRFIASFLAVLMAVCMLPAEMLGGVGVVHAEELTSDIVTITTELTKDAETGAYTAVYAGKQIKPEISIAGATESTEDATGDYTVEYGDNITCAAGGTVTVKPVAGGNFDGASDLVIPFTIKPFTLATKNGTEGNTTVTATGKKGDAKPDVTVVVDGFSSLTEDVDYEVTLGANSGTAAVGETVDVTVTGKGNFDGSATGTWTVAAPTPTTIDLSTATVALDWTEVTGFENNKVTYNGSAVAPKVAVTASDGSTPIDASNYKVTYKKGDDAAVETAPTSAGTYTIVIDNVDGKSTGSKDAGTFTIEKAAVTVKAAANEWIEGSTNAPKATADAATDYVFDPALVTGNTVTTHSAIVYKKADAAITDWSTVKADDDITIELSTAPVVKDADGNENYAVTLATTGLNKLNVKPAANDKTDGKYVIDFSKYTNDTLPAAGEVIGGKIVRGTHVSTDANDPLKNTPHLTTYDADVDTDGAINKPDGWTFAKDTTNVFVFGGNTTQNNYTRALQFTTDKAVNLIIGAFTKNATSGVLDKTINGDDSLRRSLIVYEGAPSSNVCFKADSQTKIDTLPGYLTFSATNKLEELSLNLSANTYSIGCDADIYIAYIIIEEIDDAAVAAPKANPETTNVISSASEVAAGTEVALSSDTGEASIVYAISTNGTVPADSAVTTPYTAAIELNTAGTTIIKAKATKDGMTDSNIVTFVYKVTEGSSQQQVEAPTATPTTTAEAATAAEVTKGTKVALSSDTTEASIVYAISKDGTAPEDSAVTTPYTAEIDLDTAGTTIIKAKATKDGMTDSNIVTFVYKVTEGSSQQQVEAPTATPTTTAEAATAAEVTKGAKVALSSDTTEASIVYAISTNGTAPEDSAVTTPYTDEIDLDTVGTTIIKAQATKTGMTASSIVTFVYKVKEAEPAQKYTVTLVKADGTTVVGEPTEVEAGGNYTFPAEVPTLTPADDTKYFAGWQNAEDTSDSLILWNPKEVWDGVYENLTFKEVWRTKPTDKKFTVTFKDYYGDVIDKLTKTDVESGTQITVPEAASNKSGYEFIGWEVEEDGTFKPGQIYIVKEADVTFREYWEEEELLGNGMKVRVYDPKYTGKAVKPYVEVTYNGEWLDEGTDYTLKFKNNVNADGKKQPYVTVTGKNNYAGAVKKDIPFTIRKADIWNDTECANELTVVEKAKVSPLIIYNGKVLKLNKDFTLSGDGLENGKYTAPTAEPTYDETTGAITNADQAYKKLKVTGTGNFNGSFDITVRVISKDAAKKAKLVVDTKDCKFTYGDEINETILFVGSKPKTENGTTTYEEPAKVKVYVKGDSNKTQLKKDVDFKVLWSGPYYDDGEGGSYLDIERAGSVKFTVMGIGAYTGNVSKSFKISPKKLAADDIVAGVVKNTTREGYYITAVEMEDPATVAYGVTPDISVLKKVTETVNGESKVRYYYLEEDEDYKVSYSGNKKVTDKAKAKITFLGDYKGSKANPVTFKVEAAGLRSSDIETVVPDMAVKAGKAAKAKPMVYYGGTLLKASDYTLTYEWASASKITKDATGATTGYTNPDNNKVKVAFEGEDKYVEVRITIEPKGNYKLATYKDGDQEKTVDPIYAYYKVWKIDGGEKYDLSKAKVKFYEDDKCTTELKKGVNFCDKLFYTPDVVSVAADGTVTYEKPVAYMQPVYVKVTVKQGKTEVVVPANLYGVEWINNYGKGKATVIIEGYGAPETTNTPAPQDDAGTGSGGEGGTTPTTPTVDYAIGSRNAALKINSIGKWIDPVKPSVDNTVANILEKLF